MPDIRVLLVDDHPIICKGITEILNENPGIKVIGIANDGEQALKKIDEVRPDLVILDMEMPLMNGVQVMQEIKHRNLPVKILGLSSYDDREYISELMALGACGYLLKDEVIEVIVDAVHGIARGEIGWVSRGIAAKLNQLSQENKPDDNQLTTRESEVLQRLIEGITNAEIGRRLGISEKTVEKHIEAIFRKMGVSSRVEAAVKALRDPSFADLNEL